VAAAGAHTLVVLVPGVLLARAPDVATGLQTLLSAPWSGSDESRVVAVALWTLTLTASALLSGSWLAGEMFARYVPATHPWRPAMRSAAWSAAVVLLWMFPPTTDRDFLYFRF
jgi:hypothetical protein